jgi:hypothetical protein
MWSFANIFFRVVFELYSSCIGFFRPKGALSGSISAASVSISDRVLGFFRLALIAEIYGVSLVSIPDRVLGFFRPYQARQLIDSLKAEAQVSIPDRVLGFFRPSCWRSSSSCCSCFTP